jgi:hypothetical protein
LVSYINKIKALTWFELDNFDCLPLHAIKAFAALNGCRKIIKQQNILKNVLSLKFIFTSLDASRMPFISLQF